MQVLQKVCPRCGFVMLFSVEVLSKHNSAEDIGLTCPACQAALPPDALLTDVDLEDQPPPCDLEAVRKAIGEP